MVATGMAETLSAVQVLPKGCERVLIETFETNTRLLCPAGKLMGATKQVLDAMRLVALVFEPIRKAVEVGAGRARAIALQRRLSFEIGAQHAALLQLSP
jgi:hypothetical protein